MEKQMKAMQKKAAGESFQSVADLSDAFEFPLWKISKHYQPFLATGAIAELANGGNQNRMLVRSRLFSDFLSLDEVDCNFIKGWIGDEPAISLQEISNLICYLWLSDFTYDNSL